MLPQFMTPVFEVTVPEPVLLTDRVNEDGVGVGVGVGVGAVAVPDAENVVLPEPEQAVKKTQPAKKAGSKTQ